MSGYGEEKKGSVAEAKDSAFLVEVEGVRGAYPVQYSDHRVEELRYGRSVDVLMACISSDLI